MKITAGINRAAITMMDSSDPHQLDGTATSSDASIIQNAAASSTGTYRVSVSAKYWITGDPENAKPTETMVWSEASGSLPPPDLRSSRLPDAVPHVKVSLKA